MVEIAGEKFLVRWNRGFNLANCIPSPSTTTYVN